MTENDSSLQGASNLVTVGLDNVLDCIRPAVRASDIYLVKAFEGISVKLNQNESPFDVPAPLKARILNQLSEENWNRYPDEFAFDLQSAIGRNVGHPPQGILLGNGSNELTYLLGLTLIRPDMPVVLLEPMFSLYKKVVALHEGVSVPVLCRDDFTTDPGAVIETVQRTQAPLVILTTPNNPTGQIIPLDDIERIVAVAPGFVVVDEAYYEFMPGQTAQTLMDRYPNVLILRTFSKAVGLAGLRLGYLLGHPAVITELSKARLPFMINRLTAAVALELMDQTAWIEDRVRLILSLRDQLIEALRAVPKVQVVPSFANFVIFKTPIAPERLVGLMAGQGVLIRNVSSYPKLSGYVRVNAGQKAENHAFIAALEGVLNSELGNS